MLVLRLERFGPPDMLEAVDVPMPVAEPGSWFSPREHGKNVTAYGDDE